MGKTQGAYNIEFPTGTSVKIADRGTLENFLKNWKYHDKLTPEQVEYHDRVALVERTGIYFGGDELYWLEGIPGTWHEQCLSAHPEPGKTAS
jgi:hypothetical protein